MLGRLRIGFVFCAIVIVLSVLLPIHLIGLVLAKFGWTWLAGTMPVIFHRCVLSIIGVRFHIEGKLSDKRPLLLVSNHLSWLDIVVLGATGPLSFVAKSEMAGWPVLGLLAKLQRTVFIKRELRSTSGQQANDIADRMSAHEVMVLFPEGTTTDGNQLAQFKTPLFEAAKIALAQSPVETATVQPVAIEYTRLHGLPIGRDRRPHVAWPGEIGLGESLFPLIREGALDVCIHFGSPIELSETSNRKIIASEAVKAIRSMLDSSS